MTPKKKPNPKLDALWSKLDMKQRARLSRLAGKTPGSMQHVVKGRRGISSELAVRLERAASKMKMEISRTDLNPTCGRCEFARACLKGIPL